MRILERHQNAIPGDTINLRLVTFNSNLQADVSAINGVDIYFLDPTLCDDCNKDGRRLVQSIPASQVVGESTGQYLLPLVTSAPTYTIGRYLDVWNVVFRENDNVATIENRFEIYSDLWYTSTLPAVYGFDFQFQPNRIRKGSIKWLIIKIIPNVPRATDLERYYTNLAISSNLTISIEQVCNPCPTGCDAANLIVDNDLVTIRDKVFGYYQIDTTDTGPGFECGLYDITFSLSYAGSIDVSPRSQLQIF